MNKFLVICISLMSLASCAGYIDITEETDIQYYKNKIKADVLHVTTFNQEFIFSERKPGRMTGECIKGVQQILLEDFGPDSLMFANEPGSSIKKAYKDGTVYKVIDDKNTRMVYLPEEKMCIPITEIEKLHLRVFVPDNTFKLIGGFFNSLIHTSSRMVANVTNDMGLGR